MEYLRSVKNKIFKQKEIAGNLLQVWRFKEEKIVFTNGCFDILHRGHVEYLAKAATLGSKLIIGLNTDASVKRLKGKNKPVNDEKSRAIVLAGLFFVDMVIFFDENTPYDLIKYVHPDILTKGSDYKPEDIVGYDIVKAKNGEIITIPLTKGFSTSSIFEKIQKI